MNVFTTLIIFASLAILSQSAGIRGGYATASDRSPLYGMMREDEIPNAFIVMFKHDYTIERHWQTIGMNLSSTPGFRHWSLLSGYRATFNVTALNFVRQDENVAFVETDSKTQAHASKSTQLSPNGNLSSFQVPRDYTTRVHRRGFIDPHHLTPSAPHFDTAIFTSCPWNHQIITAYFKLSPADFNEARCEMMSQAGRGVNVYVMGSGIRVTNPYFNGNARNFRDPFVPDESMDDTTPLGDGTAMAGIVSALGVGVTQSATILNVKVTDKQYVLTVGKVIDAISAICEAHQQNSHRAQGMQFRGSIILIPFTVRMPSMQDRSREQQAQMGALTNVLLVARTLGIQIVSGAGESEEFATQYWPCNTIDVICVGAIDRDYTVPDFSGQTQGIACLAPGVNIQSLSLDSISDTTVLGTAYAAAHVARILAIFISWKGLAGGGVSAYLWLNKLYVQNLGMPLANTGIQNPIKSPGEPFLDAGLEPAAFNDRSPVRLQAGEVGGPITLNAGRMQASDNDHETQEVEHDQLELSLVDISSNDMDCDDQDSVSAEDLPGETTALMHVSQVGTTYTEASITKMPSIISSGKVESSLAILSGTVGTEVATTVPDSVVKALHLPSAE